MFKRGLLLGVVFCSNFALIGSEKLRIAINNNEHLNFADGLKKIAVVSVPVFFAGISLIHTLGKPEDVSPGFGLLILLGQIGSAAWAGTQFAELQKSQERRVAENERLREQLRSKK